MEFFLWLAAALLLWILGGVCFSRGSTRSSLWLLVGNTGFGLCFLSVGILALERPPVGPPLWTRLFWSTVILTGPAWVAFSHRFGRSQGSDPGQIQKLLLTLLWISGAVLLALGLASPPLEVTRTEAGEILLVLVPPLGRWITAHVLACASVVLWNLHATLEAARTVSQRRTIRAIYALVPLVMTGLYVLAELLLYGQQHGEGLILLLGATILSSIGFSAAVGTRSLGSLSLPIGRPVVLSSVVLTALGTFFVGLAFLADLLRRLAVTGNLLRYQEAVVAILVVILSFWIFPGIREETGRFFRHRFPATSIGREEIWEKMESALAPVDGMENLGVALRILLRETFGPVRIHLWIHDTMSNDFTPVGAGAIPRLEANHPLVRALRSGSEPLLVAGAATRVEEVPLFATCEEIEQRHGLRVFFPIRAGGDLVAVMGCGPGGGRTLHPEDIDLLRKIADRLLAGRIAAMICAGRTGADEEGGEGGVGRDRENPTEVAIVPWLGGLLDQAKTETDSPVQVRLDVTGPDRVRLDRVALEPMIRYLLAGAHDPSETGGNETAVRVRVLAGDRIEFDVGSGRITLSLRLTTNGPTPRKKAGTNDARTGQR